MGRNALPQGQPHQQEIAEKVGVSRQTIARWAKEDKWEELKVGITMSREQQIAGLHRQIAEINKVVTSRPEGQRFTNAAEPTPSTN